MSEDTGQPRDVLVQQLREQVQDLADLVEIAACEGVASANGLHPAEELLRRINGDIPYGAKGSLGEIGRLIDGYFGVDCRVDDEGGGITPMEATTDEAICPCGGT